MLWLGIDFETTGLDIQNDRITEMGAVLWDTERASPVQIFNTLIRVDKSLTAEITELTGISNDDVGKYGRPFVQAFTAVFEMADKASHMIAHNGTNFDNPIFKVECARNGLKFLEKPWIDSATDVPYPLTITTRKLTHLAAEHGFLNPFAHRAVFDVLTMLSIASKYDASEIIRYHESPSITVRASVEFQDRAKASSRGYRWNPETRQWLKTIKEFQLEDEIKNADFRVIQLGRA